MPPRYPKQDGRFLAWARTITRVWSGWQPGGGSTGVPDIGLSEQQAQRAVELFEAAYAAHTHQLEMQSLARAATMRKREAFKAFKAEIGADMSTINAYAKATRDPDVFARAQLAARKKASRQHPVAPYAPRLRFVVSEGAMVLTWKGRTRPGTIYHVQRRLWGEGVHQPFYQAIAAVSERRYADTTIPPGTTSVQYIVNATKNGRTAHGFTTGASLHGEQWKPRAGAVTARTSRSA
jgi:hypothetical protein